ncbi:MAG: PilZ domain-containing protein [Rhizobiaceae bacterium]
MSIQNKAGATARIFNERRRAERERSATNALVRFNSGSETTQCVARNISARGARLVVSGAASVPPRFQLKLDTEREWRNVTVRWRRGDEVGVSFDR